MGIVVVFAIAAIIVVTIYGLSQGKSLLGSSKNEAMTNELSTISAQMSSHYTTLGSFTGATTASEIANGDIPSTDVDTATGTVNTPYGGTLVISGPGSVNGGSNNAVGLTVNDMSQQDCIKLATSESAYGINSGSTVGGGVNAIHSPATDAEAQGICTAPEANTLTFTYTLGG